MQVKIENYRKYESGGAFQGFFTLVLESPRLAIYGCKHFKNATGHWFKLPQREVQVEGEETEYYPIFSFKDPEYFNELKSAVYDALQEVSNDKIPKVRPTEIQGDSPADWL